MAVRKSHPLDPRAEQDMVHWYDPRQLLGTGLRVLLSYVLRERVDRRVMDAFSGHQRIFDYSGCARGGEEFWLDYVADVGDGYDSTYEVARQLARRELSEITTTDGKPLPRGHVLIMGGDQVYPAASRSEYDNRLRLPYERAFSRCHDQDSAPKPDHQPDRELGLGAQPGRALYTKEMARECAEGRRYPGLFAIPGNHDWYDGLACFTRLFCQERTIGGLQTYQNRSYFALRLPHDWWLLAIDVQLTDYIDRPQRDYFKSVIDRMGEDDKVILCMSTPSWEPAEGFEVLTKGDFWSSRDSHVFLEERIFKKAHINLWLSGDLHYYRRYECRGDGASVGHMVTCGGGGAFLHPTHTRRSSYEAVIAGREVDITEQAVYPDRATSRKLALKRYLPLCNPRTAYGAGLVTSLIYLILGWYVVSALGQLEWSAQPSGAWPVLAGAGGVLQATRDFAFFFLLHPFALFWLSVTLGFCYVLTPTHYKRWTRLFSAGSHLLAHLVALIALAWLGMCIAPKLAALMHEAFDAVISNRAGNTQTHAIRRETLEYLAVGFVAVGGFSLGKMVVAGYLTIAVTFTNVQGNNTFAMLRIPDFKCFLRVRLCRDRLEVYAVKIDRVGRHRRAQRGSKSAPAAEGRVQLIECFTVPARDAGAATTGATGD